DGNPANDHGLVRINLGPNFAKLTNIAIKMSSVQIGEEFRLLTNSTSSISGAILLHAGTNTDDDVAVPLSGVQQDLFVQAGTGGDTVLNSITANACGKITNTAKVTASVNGTPSSGSSADVTIDFGPCNTPATFVDVPTDDPFFSYVEALAASGITAGCST